MFFIVPPAMIAFQGAKAKFYSVLSGETRVGVRVVSVIIEGCAECQFWHSRGTRRQSATRRTSLGLSTHILDCHLGW
jgi:hypothetical protein